MLYIRLILNRDRRIMRLLPFFPLLSLIFLFCDRTLGPDRNDPGDTMVKDHVVGEMMVDRFTVTVCIDTTEGFSHERIFHKIEFAAHLTDDGIISDYFYNSLDVQYGITVDYLGRVPEGTVFEHVKIEWTSATVEAGTAIPFTFTAHAGVGENNRVSAFTFDSTITVTKGKYASGPAAASVQLTDQPFSCGRPVYSHNGQWIFYCAYNQESRMNSIRRITPDGLNDSEVLGEEMLGSAITSAVLTDDDAKVACIVSGSGGYSRMIFYDLHSSSIEEVQLDEYIWDSKLIKIPGEQKYICRSDPNRNDWESNIVIINAGDGTVEPVILQSTAGYIGDYDYRETCGEISYSAPIETEPAGPVTIDYIYRLATGERRSFLIGMGRDNIVWGPDDGAFTFIRDGHVWYRKIGLERQLTFYPGEDRDHCFSPDTTAIVFSSSRRGECQIWKVALEE
jgi:hypothetical protein